MSERTAVEFLVHQFSNWNFLRWIQLASLALLLAVVDGNGCYGEDTQANPFSNAYRNRFGRLPVNALPGDTMAARTFHAATESLAQQWQQATWSYDRWKSEREGYRIQIFEMLGLDPLPEKTELNSTVTGVLDHPDFIVEKLHFQSRPGLYATANVYIPKNLTHPVPAILYVCGHGQSKIDGVSYGNKVTYQHHGAWFARNGYVCLVLDTVQLGEIEGIHHGTHNKGMWWWNSRGYTAAGAEAWNCIRAIDYLQSRPEVDGSRIGVTGRSGGGAYSWWVAALDERIQAACPVAGITDLQNHIVDGCVEGHCDCMYLVNTYRWDYFLVAALVAPRPLLICNTDKDSIFPLDGVVRLHGQVRQIYDLYDLPDHLGLVITEGPHKDTQELQLPVLRWFNRWLKNDETPVANFAEKLFTPEQLKVFQTLPQDEITSRCYEDFTLLANESETFSPDDALTVLRLKTFGAWPSTGAIEIGSKLIAEQVIDGVCISVREFTSQENCNLRFYHMQPVGSASTSIHIDIVDEEGWQERLRIVGQPLKSLLFDELQVEARSINETGGTVESDFRQFSDLLQEIREQRKSAIAFAPRGIGLSKLSGDSKYQTHLRRRYMLLGATLASTQVWDVLRCFEEIRSLDGHDQPPVHVRADREMTEVAAFATLFSKPISSLTLKISPRDDVEAPDFLNWSRLITPKQLRSLVERSTQLHIQP